MLALTSTDQNMCQKLEMKPYAIPYWCSAKPFSQSAALVWNLFIYLFLTHLYISLCI